MCKSLLSDPPPPPPPILSHHFARNSAGFLLVFEDGGSKCDHLFSPPTTASILFFGQTCGKNLSHALSRSRVAGTASLSSSITSLLNGCSHSWTYVVTAFCFFAQPSLCCWAIRIDSSKHGQVHPNTQEMLIYILTHLQHV